MVKPIKSKVHGALEGGKEQVMWDEMRRTLRERVEQSVWRKVERGVQREVVRKVDQGVREEVWWANG